MFRATNSSGHPSDSNSCTAPGGRNRRTATASTFLNHPKAQAQDNASSTRQSGSSAVGTPGGATASQANFRKTERPAQKICIVCKQSVVRGDRVCSFCLLFNRTNTNNAAASQSSGLCGKQKLSEKGGATAMCDYCHLRPRIKDRKQCLWCLEKAKTACLVCKSRPRNEKGVYCGFVCKKRAAEQAPALLEVPRGHEVFDMVEDKYLESWKDPKTSPAEIKRLFKVVGSDSTSRPYTAYRKAISNEQFRYHGTNGDCGLGVGSTQFCSSASCAACNICKGSFKVASAKPTGAFGKAIYTTSDAHKAHKYGGKEKVMFVNKVVLGKSHEVAKFNEVKSCPPGANSVTFNNKKGDVNWNETVVYSDNAIRPVFMLTF